MKARFDRTHDMGFSNRIRIKNTSNDIFERSFNKSQSQYYQVSNKISENRNINPTQAKSVHENLNRTKSTTCHQVGTFNTLYKQSTAGNHNQFSCPLISTLPRQPYVIPTSQSLPIARLSLAQKLNQSLPININQYGNVNLHKLRELKDTFVRNNRKRRNLKHYFNQYKNQNGQIDRQGIRNMVRQFGYDLNQQQVRLMLSLNHVHQQHNNDVNNQQQDNGINDHHIHNMSNPSQTLNLQQFVNLMTKQNIYFKTLKLNQSKQSLQNKQYQFSPPDFQIFRNKFKKLKQAFHVVKDQAISFQSFQKVMKKLDLNDLVIKPQKRQQIFNNFVNQKGLLNVQAFLGQIVSQQYTRVNSSTQPLSIKSDNFSQNLPILQQKAFSFKQSDPLNQILQPSKLKNQSFTQYQRSLDSSKQMLLKIKQINQQRPNILQKIFKNRQKVNRNVLFRNLEHVLKSEGFNFNAQQYKAFVSYLDFDHQGYINQQNMNKYLFNQTQKEVINRLDRRIRNPQSNDNNHKLTQLNKLNPSHNQLNSNHSQLNQLTEVKSQKQDEFVDKMRSKSCFNWTGIKKVTMKQQNATQLKVPTKFSAWPQRLYNPDFSLIQAKSTIGMGMAQADRFNKNEKFTYGMQQKQKKQRIYLNKIRKTSQWQNHIQKRVQAQIATNQNKQVAKQFQMRLLKQQYQQKCHSNSVIA